jgi:hypothetical protein
MNPGAACAAVFAVAGLAGCAQTAQPLYSWETFPRQQYAYLLREGVSPGQQIKEIEAHAEKARAANLALPPGLRAHLGMLYLSVGNPGRAAEMWTAEKTAFPESAPYMDQLLQRVAPGAVKQPAVPAKPEDRAGEKPA